MRMRMRMRMPCDLESSIAIRGEHLQRSAVRWRGRFELNFKLRLGDLRT